MNDRARHTGVLLLATGLLAGIYVLRPTWHAALGALVFTATRVFDPEVAKRAGAPRRWIATSIVLVAVGLWLGPTPQRLGGLHVSTSGALAATTMMARAMGIILVGAATGALYPAHRALSRLRATRLRRFAEVLVIALDLLPSLIVALEGARSRIAAADPGLLRAPHRAFEMLVFSICHASTLADSVAARLSMDQDKGTT